MMMPPPPMAARIAYAPWNAHYPPTSEPPPTSSPPPSDQPQPSLVEAAAPAPQLPAPPPTRSFHIRIVLISASTTIVSDANLELASLTASEVQRAVACVAAQAGVSDLEDTSVRVMRTNGQIGVHCSRGRVVILGAVVNVVDSDGEGWEERLDSILSETMEREDVMVVVEMREEAIAASRSGSNIDMARGRESVVSEGRQSGNSEGRQSGASVHSQGRPSGGSAHSQGIRSPGSIHSQVSQRSQPQREPAASIHSQPEAPAGPVPLDDMPTPPSRQPSVINSPRSHVSLQPSKPSKPGSPGGSIRSQQSLRSRDLQHDTHLGDTAPASPPKSIHSNVPA